ncbi:hypothetical protein GGR57DRAFT_508376 [Xylariaceae sp. FL1272]|nr:hypothetical protein GGR57DRAFT_508376 [Xylariaceae sp. FL1272]
MSSQPLLGGAHDTRKSTSKRGIKSALPFLNIIRGGLIAPSATTYDSIYIILNTPDTEKQDELTRRWMDHKLEELNFVGLVGGLLSGCLTSTGSWPDVLDNGREKPWVVKAFWHSGIIFAVFAVLIAMMQGLRLHRLSAHRDGLELIRKSMAKGGDTNTFDHNNEVRPKTSLVYAWQASFSFLVAAVFCLIAGMMVLVWVSASPGPEKSADHFWDDSALLALVFTIVVVLASLVLFMVQMSLTTGIRDESSE